MLMIKDKSGSDSSDERSSSVESDSDRIGLLRHETMLRDLDDFQHIEQNRTRNLVSSKIRVRVASKEIRALIDTRAQINAVSKDLYDELLKSDANIATIPINRFTVRGAFADKGEIIAFKTAMDVTIGEKTYVIEFYIMKKLAYDMILGMEFLARHRAVINCTGEVVQLSLEESANIAAIQKLTTQEVQSKINEILSDNKDLFTNEIGCVTHYTHRIKMNTKVPYKAKTYPIPEVHREAVTRYIDELERDGIIKRAPTQYINPLVVVIKKNGKIRLCLDARELNKRMANDHAQPPSIEEVFQQIGHRKYFTTLDVTQAFWQIPLEEESQKYTGFMFNNQTYVFQRLPFGFGKLQVHLFPEP